MTSLEHARDLRPPPVLILGTGQGFSHEHLIGAPSLTTFAPESGSTAYALAGIGPQDVDVAVLYDNFTISVLCQLEDLG